MALEEEEKSSSPFHQSITPLISPRGACHKEAKSDRLPRKGSIIGCAESNMTPPRTYISSDRIEHPISEHHEESSTSMSRLNPSSPGYSTFVPPSDAGDVSHVETKPDDDELFLTIFYKWFASSLQSNRLFHFDRSLKHTRHGPSSIAIAIAVLACISITFFSSHNNPDTQLQATAVDEKQHTKQQLEAIATAEWIWDHNTYNPEESSKRNEESYDCVEGAKDEYILNDRPCQRNLLIAQVAGGTKDLVELADICSRPNRAYARRWGRDYVRYAKPRRNLARSCFDKVELLRAILDFQQQQEQQSISSNSNTTTHSNHSWRDPIQPSRTSYDAVALFPLDAIISDLDNDLLNLLPEDKLLAIAGWDGTSTTKCSDVVFFNLRHNYASAVIEAWDALVEPPESCGAANDFALLLQAVESVLEENQHLSSMVVSFDQNDQKGTLAGNAIKVIPARVPGNKAVMLANNQVDSRTILQTTADSVCYRYYPGCDVL